MISDLPGLIALHKAISEPLGQNGDGLTAEFADMLAQASQMRSAVDRSDNVVIFPRSAGGSSGRSDTF